VIAITFPIQLTNDNEGRSQHWSKASKRKRSYAAIVRVISGKRVPFSEPVALRITRIIGPGERLWDADSIGRGSVKELIDSLVGAKWLVDDGPKWVTAVQYHQEVDRKNGPGVRVEFICGQSQATRDSL
jgi:hypothetical protein